MKITAGAKRLLFPLKKSYWISCIILLIVYGGVVLCTAFNTEANQNTAPVYTDFAGSQACVSCHKDICESGVHTAHYLTSAPSTFSNIKGSFEQDKNHFVYNAFMQVEMDTIEGLPAQVAYANGVAYEARSFDITVGSGRMGQTYLYWDSSYLYQLPVSYFTPLQTWCNSPGFPAGFIKFTRPINTRCMECHGTYATATVDNGKTTFNKEQILYGVQCERCHGAAAKHVAYQTAHPADTMGMFILHIKNLSRQQKLDACALCHSGIRNAVKPSFTYQVGDKLDDFLTPKYSQDSLSMLDVHGNQFGLLTSSKCFQMSGMDCSSCHNTHVTEEGNKLLFSQRCATCHNNVQHSFATTANTKAIMSNCIDCHMPSLPSSKIVLQLSGSQQQAPDYVTTHHIAVYPDQTKAFLKNQ